jgi:hypothetical protein
MADEPTDIAEREEALVLFDPEDFEACVRRVRRRVRVAVVGGAASDV